VLLMTGGRMIGQLV